MCRFFIVWLLLSPPAVLFALSDLRGIAPAADVLPQAPLSGADEERLSHIFRLKNAGEPGEAIDLLRKWVAELPTSRPTPDAKSYFLRRTLADWLQEDGQFGEALVLWRSLIPEASSAGPSPPDPNEVTTLRVESALCEEVVKLPGPKQADVRQAAQLLVGGKSGHTPQEQLERERALRQAAEIIKSNLGERNSLYVKSLTRLAGHFKLTGQFEKCLEPLS
jgi:hypothetical protein